MIKATRRSACDALDQVTVTTASKAAARRRVISCILMPPCAEEQWRYSRIRLDYHILPPAAIFFQRLEQDKFPCGRPAKLATPGARTLDALLRLKASGPRDRGPLAHLGGDEAAELPVS